MKKWFLKVWKDSVGSSVIASVIFLILSRVFLKIYCNTTLTEFLNLQIKLWHALILLVAILTLTKLINYYKKSRKEKFQYNSNSRNIDIYLFDEIRNDMLPYDLINWVEFHNFGGYKFKEQKLYKFEAFQANMASPNKEFLNPELEELRRKLLYSIKEFTSFTVNTIFRQDQKYLTVPPEWETEQPERFNNAVKGLHNKTQDVVKKYEDFLKKGRRILEV